MSRKVSGSAEGRIRPKPCGGFGFQVSGLILLKNSPFILREAHRDASLVHVRSRKHIVLPRNEDLASDRSASLMQWLIFQPLYLLLSTRGEPRHPSYKSQDERRRD
jgi:hypothetical protein